MIRLIEGSVEGEGIRFEVDLTAPAEDEILIALGASIGGHPLHRIGNRYDDLRDMGRDVDNPAGV